MVVVVVFRVDSPNIEIFYIDYIWYMRGPRLSSGHEIDSRIVKYMK